MLGKTIAAISTPPGKGGIAVIRISGFEALDIASKIFCSASGLEAQRAVYGRILSDNRVIDDGVAVYFAAPHSFTGEDTVEISCHGGRVITSMVLSAAIAAGAVQAEPGEFTRRAFVNGKLTLTRAEGIADLLDAVTEEAAALSSSAARGRLSEELSGISEELLRLTSSLFAFIDYPDEDMQEVPDREIEDTVRALIGRVERLISSYGTGRAVTEGIPTLILGRPNVGKSSLFNWILGENKAIVTDISGTTRDILEYPAKVGRVLLRLCDTAGIRSESSDEIEKIGIDMALSRLSDGGAQLVLILFDSSRALSDDDRRLIGRVKSARCEVIPIITKTDLSQKLDEDEIKASLGKPVRLSVKGAAGIDELSERIEGLYIDGSLDLLNDAVITNARQLGELKKLSALLGEALTKMDSGAKDICLVLLEEALAAVNATDGRGTSEMIVNEIFSRFCVGK